jgi:predicted transglutaminase-like cysteine proteinase
MRKVLLILVLALSFTSCEKEEDCDNCIITGKRSLEESGFSSDGRQIYLVEVDCSNSHPVVAFNNRIVWEADNIGETVCNTEGVFN